MGTLLSRGAQGAPGRSGPLLPFSHQTLSRLKHTQKTLCFQRCCPDAQARWAGVAALSTPLQQGQ